MGTPSQMFTRRSFVCPILGNPQDLPNNRLPTREDVLRCCFQERVALAKEMNYTTVNFSLVADIVADKVLHLFVMSSIPTVVKVRVLQMIHALHNSYYTLRKSFSRDKDRKTFQEKLELFKQQATQLFDIASCKCTMTFDCTCGKMVNFCKCPVLLNCSCEKSRKIPPLEVRFLYDQRNNRSGRIGAVDKEETSKLLKRMSRKEKNVACLESNGGSSSSSQPQSSVLDDLLPVEPAHTAQPETENDPNYVPSLNVSPPNKSSSLIGVELKSTALICDRFGISDRAAAALASSVLKDLGIITEGDTSLVIDKNKIRRERSRCRESLQSGEEEVIRGLFFDGRNDSTLVVEAKESKRFTRTVKEYHVSVIKEPGSTYIDHVTPDSESGKDVASSIYESLEDRNIGLDYLDVIGCDGTAVNTGWKAGAIRFIELHLDRPLQRVICLLHFNELPLRHLFETLDGKTSGPASYSGPIGKSLAGCENLPVVGFKAVDCEIPEVDVKDLSKDQRYLLKISSAIKNGACPPDLAVSDPGPLSHARWLTTANRVLRVYISTAEPSDNLMHLVKFILTSYMPVWFAVKKEHSIIHAPKHLLNAILLSRYLPVDLRRVVDTVIQRNAFFAHSENLLLAMAMDEREHIRELALRRILKARTAKPRSVSRDKNPVRYFKVPSVNFDATDYSDLVDWSSCDLSSPPLLRRVSSDEIKSLIETKSKPDWDVHDFPCHTQSVERCVKLVTEASERCYGHANRDGYIRSTLKSRKELPNLESKAGFVDSLRRDR